jgi:PRC-barrel domain
MTPVADETRADAELPAAEEALGWTGAKLDAMGGSSVGRVEGVLVDAESGDPTWLLVRIGRFGHHTALPFSHAVAGVNRVWAPYARDMVRRAPRIDAGRPLERERELELCSFYGIGEDAGRGSEIADRPDGAVTSRPAPPPA